jgi:transcriptional regulator with XRE-family HTH domain
MHRLADVIFLLSSQRFGKRVGEIRLKRKWSQEKLTEESGLHTTYISGIERGRRNVEMENVVKLARALKVDVGQLFKGVR